MANITGRITEITEIRAKKNIVTIKSKQNDQIAYIEFRGVLKIISDKYSVGDPVKITYIFKGCTAKTGQRFNNVVALRIEKI